ncbi:MAG: M20 family metallopeptidase [Candidatus Hodarchaeales archaeon]
MNENHDTWKDQVCSYLDEIQEELIVISKKIFDTPELGFQEFEASRLLVDHLQNHGIDVEVGVAGLETAFRAVHPAKKGSPIIAVLAEYDALPDIGHGCGHNLIATAALGAFLAVGSIKKKLPGTILLLGTPAEEEGGGKITMVSERVFKEIDAAMMFHPSSGYTMVNRGSLALTEVGIEFSGKAAHASASPEQGINALDAVIQTFNAINALRQHIRDGARIHGIITHGGTKPNIVPDYAAAEFYVRAADNKYCNELLEKFESCAKGAALATGATLSFKTIGHSYQAMKLNRSLGEAFTQNLRAIEVPLKPLPKRHSLGSTDMGNVSQVVPAIHPYLEIADENVAGHSKEFAQAAASEKGQQAMINAAKALAMTMVDLLSNSDLMTQVRKEFESA